jgi:hypothetical protein
MNIVVEVNQHDDLWNDPEWPLFTIPDWVNTASDVPSIALVEFITRCEDLPRDMDRLFEISAASLKPYLISRVRPELKAYLFIGVSSPQPDNRISRYKKLWKDRNHPFDNGDLSPEYLMESASGLRYYGVVRIHEGNYFQAMKELDRLSSIAVISDSLNIHSEESMRYVFNAAFPQMRASTPRRGSIDILNATISLCPRGDIIVRPSGDYDDRFACFDCIMRQDLVSSFMNP